MQHIQSKVSTPSNSTTYAHTCINTTVIAKIRRLNYSVLYIISVATHYEPTYTSILHYTFRHTVCLGMLMLSWKCMTMM